MWMQFLLGSTAELSVVMCRAHPAGAGDRLAAGVLNEGASRALWFSVQWVEAAWLHLSMMRGAWPSTLWCAHAVAHRGSEKESSSRILEDRRDVELSVVVNPASPSFARS